MNKILKSSVSIVGVVALVVGLSLAYFSDTETSTGNTFTAGAIDLSLGGNFSSTSNGNPGVSALLANNDGRAVYTFTDLKPGDMGGGSFNLEVTSNEAYVCAKSEITSTPENGVNDPEVAAGDTIANGLTDGELQNYLQFATFDDENENGAYDAGEDINVGQYDGDGNGITAAEFEAAGWVAVADTTYPNTWLVEQTLPANTLQSAGMLYCFGNFETEGTLNDVVVTGCDGSGDQNIAQTDGVVGSIEFYAVQTRNNEGFTCESMNPQPPVIDGVVTQDEWDGARQLDITGTTGPLGSVSLKQMGDYLYVLFNSSDNTDDRLTNTLSGNDKFAININPTGDADWGKPYGLVVQVGTDPCAFTTTAGGCESSGNIDNYETEWVVNGVQSLTLPSNFQSKTIYGSTGNITEWRIPLSGMVLSKIAGGVDDNGKGYQYPSTLNWTQVFSTSYNW